MYKLFSASILTICLGLAGCATNMLSTALPNETTEIKTTTLKTDQIIALGQAVKNEQEQGFVFVDQDYNYLMTDGSSNLLNIIKSIPAEQRTIKTSSPLVLEMDDSTHFHGEITIRIISLRPKWMKNKKNF